MCVATFLEAHDWNGKTVIPFTTHEGSSFGSGLRDLKAALPSATIGKGLSIQGSRVSSATGAKHPISGMAPVFSATRAEKYLISGMAIEIFPKAWHTKLAWSGAGGILPCRLSPFSGEVGTRNGPPAIPVADWRANLSEPRGHSCRKAPHFGHGSGFSRHPCRNSPHFGHSSGDSSLRSE